MILMSDDENRKSLDELAKEMREGGVDMALLLESACRQKDPLTRFIESLENPDLKQWCEQTIRMREEFISNVQRMLIETNMGQCQLYAEAVRRDAYELAYRWPTLMKAVTEHARRDFPEIIVTVRGK